MNSLQDKRKRLEEEKNSMDIATELSSDVPRVLPTRKLRRRGEAQEVKTKKRNNPDTFSFFLFFFFLFFFLCSFFELEFEKKKFFFSFH